MNERPAVEMRQVRKYFPGPNVLALDAVDFCVQPGEVHALVGENGAGKTTLMNVLYGLVAADAGEVFINGEPVQIRQPHDAIRAGIGMVHQHFKLIPSFTIAHNVMLGIEPGRLGFIDSAREARAVRHLSEEFNLPVDPLAITGELPVGMQQRVELLKTLQRDARILVLDEPTAVLTPREVRELYTVIRQLARDGRTIILITHKLLEVREVADQVSVMRRGRMVATHDVASVSIRDMANEMVGREVILRIDKAASQPQEPILEVERLLVAGAGGIPAVFGIDLELRAGEILGVAGVSGNGQTELVEAIAGLRQTEGGRILLGGREITAASVRQRREWGMAHIPEDRMAMGLNLNTTLDENVIVSAYRHSPWSRRGFFNFAAVRDLARRIVRAFNVRSARVGGEIRTLSGGNLQKIVLGRELEGRPRLIIANQPTRGLDIGSIEFVHRTLVAARDAGAAILLVSVELDEIFALSDRVAVMFEGRIMAVENVGAMDEERVGLLMAGQVETVA